MPVEFEDVCGVTSVSNSGSTAVHRYDFMYGQHAAVCVTVSRLQRLFHISVCLSVCLSVRDAPLSDENGLTYCHSFFHLAVGQSF